MKPNPNATQGAVPVSNVEKKTIAHLFLEFLEGKETEQHAADAAELLGQHWSVLGAYLIEKGEYAIQVAAVAFPFTEYVNRHIQEQLDVAEQRIEELENRTSWQAPETAPKDGTAVRLLISGGDFPLAEDDLWETIGNFGVGENQETWSFAGWNWTHDEYCEGDGEVVGWMPVRSRATPRPTKGGSQMISKVKVLPTSTKLNSLGAIPPHLKHLLASTPKPLLPEDVVEGCVSYALDALKARTGLEIGVTLRGDWTAKAVLVVTLGGYESLLEEWSTLEVTPVVDVEFENGRGAQLSILGIHLDDQFQPDYDLGTGLNVLGTGT